jgi:hypothetical protein
MRDWLLMAAPLILVVYFLVFPDHFHAMMAKCSECSALSYLSCSPARP